MTKPTDTSDLLEIREGIKYIRDLLISQAPTTLLPRAAPGYNGKAGGRPYTSQALSGWLCYLPDPQPVPLPLPATPTKDSIVLLQMPEPITMSGRQSPPVRHHYQQLSPKYHPRPTPGPLLSTPPRHVGCGLVSEALKSVNLCRHFWCPTSTSAFNVEENSSPNR